MNILVVSYYQIYPLKTGASIAQFGMIEDLSNFCQISLLVSEHYTPNDEELAKLQAMLPRVNIYTVGESLKSYSDVISSNTFNLARLLKKTKSLLKKYFQKDIKSNNIQNVLSKTSPEKEFAEFFSSYKPYFLHSKQYVEKLNEIILKDQVDIVQLEFTENLSLVTAISSNVKKIFVNHEAVFSRIESHVNAKRIKSVFTDYVYSFNNCIELSLLKNFDGILTFTESESLKLKELLSNKNQVKIFTSPYPILTQDFRVIDRQKFCKPTKLTFLGPERHFPNKDAVEWFLEEAAVEIFRRFGLRLHVVGEWSPETVRKYGNHESGVHFTGFVEDSYEITKDSISIAPVRIGGGIKTKVMLAMAQGIPVICTKFALDGINAKHLESVVVADDNNSFCWAVEYLLADLERAFLICQNAQSLMEQTYSHCETSKLRYSFYQHLLENAN